MTSLCDYMDHSDWTPEQRVSVALVETLRMKRNEDEQARAARFYARHFSTAAHSGQANSQPSDTAVRGGLIEDRA